MTDTKKSEDGRIFPTAKAVFSVCKEMAEANFNDGIDVIRNISKATTHADAVGLHKTYMATMFWRNIFAGQKIHREIEKMTTPFFAKSQDGYMRS